jgi:hypothetical protein
MVPLRVCMPVVADLHLLNKEQDPDPIPQPHPHPSDPDPKKSEKGWTRVRIKVMRIRRTDFKAPVLYTFKNGTFNVQQGSLAP